MNALQKETLVKLADTIATNLRKVMAELIEEVSVDGGEENSWITFNHQRYIRSVPKDTSFAPINIHAEAIASEIDKLQEMLEDTDYVCEYNDGGEPCITKI